MQIKCLNNNTNYFTSLRLFVGIPFLPHILSQNVLRAHSAIISDTIFFRCTYLLSGHFALEALCSETSRLIKDNKSDQYSEKFVSSLLCIITICFR